MMTYYYVFHNLIFSQVAFLSIMRQKRKAPKSWSNYLIPQYFLGALLEDIHSHVRENICAVVVLENAYIS